MIKAIAQDSNGAGSSTGNILGSTVFSNTPSGSRYALDDDFKVAESVSVEQQRKKAFFFHLNKSGVYFHMKEELKAAITDVVRERFKKKSPFAVKAEMQLFLSEVYVYLTDQMHIAINKVDRLGKRPPFFAITVIFFLDLQ